MLVVVTASAFFYAQLARAMEKSGVAWENQNTFQNLTYFTHYQHDRFDWQTLEDGNLRVNWYDGDKNFGQAALKAARSGLESISNLMPLELAQPIEVFIYVDEDDLRSTLDSGGGDWVAGHADPALGVVKVVVEPGPEQSILMEQRIPHELMHVMLYRRVGAGYSNIPAWLREGLATLAEVYPNPDYDRVLTDAAATDQLIPLKDLCVAFPPDVGQAFLAYAESRSFTNYLHSNYGSTGLLSLASYYADGVDCARGTERAFGVAFSRLELNWRESVLGGKAISSAFRNLLPYLVLLCLVLLVPSLGILSIMRRKGKGYERETYDR